jgi:ABC-2 type transport system ATP-binding protein
MHSPKLVFLDEPTTGLDPQSRANLWEHIRSLREDLGVTVVLTTHYLDEADVLADRLMVMDHGVVVADDTSENLKAKLSGDVITVTLADPQRAAAVIEKAVDTRQLKVDGERVHVTVERGDVVVAPLLRALDKAKLPLESVSVARPSLDDVFLNLTGRSLREDEEGAA